MYLDKLLKTKWEIEKQNEEGDIFVVMKQFSDRTYLHRLCRKIDMKNPVRATLLPDFFNIG